RERAELAEKEGVVNFVECRGQVRVQDPRPLGLALQRGVERLGRVLTAPTRPEPVRVGWAAQRGSDKSGLFRAASLQTARARFRACGFPAIYAAWATGFAWIQ